MTKPSRFNKFIKWGNTHLPTILGSLWISAILLGSVGVILVLAKWVLKLLGVL